MKIGIDIDEVIADSFATVISFHNEKHNLNLKRDDLCLGFCELWDCSQEEVRKRITEVFTNEKVHKTIPPIKGALDSLKKLKENNHELIAITGRRDSMIKNTKEWIEDNFSGIFSDIHFTNAYCPRGKSKNKSAVCKEIGIDVMIEDEPIHTTDCAENDIKVLLMDCPWNQSLQLENIERVFSWDDIVKKIG